MNRSAEVLDLVSENPSRDCLWRLRENGIAIIAFAATAVCPMYAKAMPDVIEHLNISDAELCRLAEKQPVRLPTTEVDIRLNYRTSIQGWPVREGLQIVGHAFSMKSFHDPAEGGTEKLVLSGFYLFGTPTEITDPPVPVDFILSTREDLQVAAWALEYSSFPSAAQFSQRTALLYSAASFMRSGEALDDQYRKRLSGNWNASMSTIDQEIPGDSYLCQSCEGPVGAFAEGGQDLRTLRIATVQNRLVFFTYEPVVGGAVIPNGQEERVHYFKCKK